MPAQEARKTRNSRVNAFTMMVPTPDYRIAETDISRAHSGTSGGPKYPGE
jgi:hypothetical protein